jgi:hypothetical protein
MEGGKGPVREVTGRERETDQRLLLQLLAQVLSLLF